MGHSTIAMTMQYIHPTPQHKKEALEKLLSFTPPPPHKIHHSATMKVA